MKRGTKKILEMVGFREQVKRVEHGFCPICGKPISMTDFVNAISRKEFSISGLCQACQDETFGKE